MNFPLSHVWLPARTPSRQLIVVLHGLGDSPEGFLWLQDVLGLDPLNYLLLQAPDSYYTGFSWYDILGDAQKGVVRSRKLLAEVFAETERDGFPPESTILFGFSQGCLMTLEFGARHTRRLAGYIGISGYTLDPDSLVRELNPEVNQGGWLITHGTKDDLLPIGRTREQMRVLREGGFKIDYREYPKVHAIDPDRELPQIREWIQGLG